MPAESFRSNVPLPIWTTIVAAYAIVFRNLGALLKAGWPSICIALGVIWAAHQWGSPTSAHVFAAEWMNFVAECVVSLLPMIAILPSAARLHRFIQAGLAIEAQPLSDVFRAAWRCLIVYSCLFLPLIIMIALFLHFGDILGLINFTSADEDGFTVVYFALLAVALVWFYFYPRLALRVAAAAVDHGAVGYADVWRMSVGNSWRLFLCFIVLIVPVALPLTLVSWLGEPSGSIAITLYAVGDAVVTMLTLLFETALLSIAYLHLSNTAASREDATDLTN